MQNNEFFELETFNKINDFNKKIYRIESRMRVLFFKNIKMNSSNEIIPPKVSTKGYSEFERINYEIKYLRLQVKNIEKKLANLQSFSNIVIKMLKNRVLSEEEYEQEKKKMFGKIKMNLEEQRGACLEKIASIESDPFAYLRFLEFQSSDFSSVEDKDIREKLEQQNGILKGYINERDSLLKRIKKSEKRNQRRILKLKPKSDKKGIDKK